MVKKVYISGKITGLIYADAYEKFARAQMMLEKEGFEVINPMNLDHSHDRSWESYMRADLIAMLGCTHIYMLKDWGESKGACLEHKIAAELAFFIKFED